MKKLIMVVFVLFCVMEYSLANYHENQNEIRCEEILSYGIGALWSVQQWVDL